MINGLLYIPIFLYVLFMLTMIIGWLFKSHAKGISESNSTTLSILVPFRNEEKNLPKLINSLLNLNIHSLQCQLIFINDHSTDGSLDTIKKFENELIQRFDMILIHQEEDRFGKKSALELGISKAKYNTVLTTDADCLLPENWLQHSINSSAKLDIGLVIMDSHTTTLVEKVQETEALLLAGITYASCRLDKPLLSTGTNLRYTKDAFLKLKPYSDNREIRSGDDMFLLKSFKRAGHSISCNKDNFVKTGTEASVKGYLARSTRWASKIGTLREPVLAIVGLIVLTANLSFLWLLVASFFNENFLFFVSGKFIIDALFLVILCIHFNKIKLLLWAPIVAIVYPIYLLIVAFSVLTYKKSNW